MIMSNDNAYSAVTIILAPLIWGERLAKQGDTDGTVIAATAPRWLWPVTNQVTTATDNRGRSTTYPDSDTPLTCGNPTACDVTRRCRPAW
jgi:hypothetical protein